MKGLEAVFDIKRNIVSFDFYDLMQTAVCENVSIWLIKGLFYDNVDKSGYLIVGL